MNATYSDRTGSLTVILSKSIRADMVLLSAALSLGFACSIPAGALQAGGSAQAQVVEEASKSAPDTPTDPTLKLSTADTLRKFEPSADEEYTLAAGDEVSIEFPGRPELSTTGAIGPDGRITLPIAGPITISNLTREAAAQKAEAAMAAYYTNITATVEILKYGSNHVTLLGAVKNPGPITFDQVPTLLEVLSRGGVETRPDSGLPDECVIYRGNQVFWVDLEDLLMSGSPLADLRLRRNDLIFVPAVTKTVTVVGQVQHAGQLALKHDSTVISLLGESGGISEAAGENPEIEIVHRKQGGRTQYVHFKSLLRPDGGREVSLHPGDVIYVPRSGLSRVGFVMQQLAPFIWMGSIGALAIH